MDGSRVHISWLIAAWCACFVAGVSSALVSSPQYWVALLCVPFLLLGIWNRRGLGVCAIGVAGVLGGAVYGAVSFESHTESSVLYGSFVRVTAVVKEDPTLGAGNVTVMQLQNVIIAGYQLMGSLWVSTTEKIDVVRGDAITIEGQYETGFGTFIAMMRNVHVVSIMRPEPGDVGRVVRDWFATSVRKGIDEPQASLGIGFLTGQKSALPEDLSESLRIAGLTHIVVASGYNLTILVRLARRLFVTHSKFLATTTASVMIAGFVCVTGLSPSMTRAGLVSGLSLLAWYYGRAFHPLVLLPFAAALTVLFQPSYAWGDLGWQLSFTAFAGVMIVAPLVQAYFFGSEPPGIIRQVIGETVSAHLVTLPIIIMAFGTVSHVAIIANVLIVPLVPLAMLLTFLVGCLSFIVPQFIEVIALPAQWLLQYMTTVATFVSELPWAQSEVSVPGYVLAIYVGALALACLYMYKKTNLSFRDSSIID